MMLICVRIWPARQRGSFTWDRTTGGVGYTKITHLQNFSISLHHSPLGNPYIVPRGVLHQIHHFVSLPDSVIRGEQAFRLPKVKCAHSHPSTLAPCTRRCRG